MNANELSNAVLRTLGDPEGDRWGADEVMGYLDEAHRDMLTRTGGNRDSSTLTVDADRTPATAFFTLPSNLLRLDRLSVNGALVDRVELAEMHEGWESDTGASVGYLLGPWGFKTLRAWPDPGASATVTAYYTTTPASLSVETTPAVPEAYHTALVHGAVARAYLKDFEAKDPQKAGVFQQMYERAVVELRTLAQMGFDATTPHVPFSYL